MKYNKKILEKINDNFKRYLGLTIENDWDLNIDEHLLNNVNNHIEYQKLIDQLELQKTKQENSNL